MTILIHEELAAAARGMEERAKALHKVAAELAGMAETPPAPVRAEVLARELLKIDLCVLHKDAVRVVNGFEGTDINARAAALMVRQSLDNMLSHQTQPNDTQDFNSLRHAVDVAHIRALQIQEGEDNPMHSPLMAEKGAMNRVRERRESSGRWGLSGTDRVALVEAVELYQTILEASSPAQMQAAVDLRMAGLNA